MAGSEVPSEPTDPAMVLDWQDRQEVIQASFSLCDEYPGLADEVDGIFNDGPLLDNQILLPLANLNLSSELGDANWKLPEVSEQTI